jgi:hypothetical protein
MVVVTCLTFLFRGRHSHVYKVPCCEGTTVGQSLESRSIEKFPTCGPIHNCYHDECESRCLYLERSYCSVANIVARGEANKEVLLLDG